MGLKEKYNEFAKQIYFRMNKTRRSRFFGVVNWFYVYFLKAVYSLFLLFSIITLIGKLYYFSLAFLIIAIGFILLSNYFSLQREYSLIVILDIIKSRIKEKNYNSIRFRIEGDLYKDIEDYVTYEINDSDSNSKRDLGILLNYLKYFLSYRDFEDQKILDQFDTFIYEIKGVFEKRAFSKIPSIIYNDFEALKKSKDYKRNVEYLKVYHNQFNENDSIFRIIAELNKLENSSKKIISAIISGLYYMEKYKGGIIVLGIIILIILFLTGIITPEMLDSISNLMPWKR